ncbi:MAG: aromatic-ring-hydroxylating dioxygenase subunit beta [Gammaproteobacteria bacterium]
MAGYGAWPIDARMRLRFEVEEFLFAEAALLDERRFDAWLDLLAEDIHYWMPIRRTTTAREVEHEFTQPGWMAFFDDDKATLTLRVQRMAVGRAWAEDPPSRTRHLLTNIRVLDVVGEEITVSANFQLYRTRLNSEEDAWLGRREDVLRRGPDGFRIARRSIFLEQTVILAQNMSSFF